MGKAYGAGMAAEVANFIECELHHPKKRHKGNRNNSWKEARERCTRACMPSRNVCCVQRAKQQQQADGIGAIRCTRARTCMSTPRHATPQSQICRRLFGHNCIGHNYTGHTYIGHNYIGHTYIGHNYIGHNYLGHISLGRILSSPVWLRGSRVLMFVCKV